MDHEREKNFANLLGSELNQLSLLLDILTRETEALLSTDISEIEALTEEKNRLLDSQRHATHAREQFMQNMTGSKGREGMEKLASDSINPKPLMATINDLNDLATHCQEINRHNGKLILKQQRYATSALNILRQENTTPTYSNQGDKVSGTSTRSFGKA